jgi:hypothetical protein
MRSVIGLADALSARGGIPSVISAVEVMVPVAGTPDSMVFYTAAVLDEEFHYNRRRSLEALIATATGKDQDWPITSVVGDPVRATETDRSG